MYIVYHLRRLVYRINAAHQADGLHARRSSGGNVANDSCQIKYGPCG